MLQQSFEWAESSDHVGAGSMLVAVLDPSTSDRFSRAEMRSNSVCTEPWRCWPRCAHKALEICSNEGERITMTVSRTEEILTEWVIHDRDEMMPDINLAS
jgi:hypothetical protein